MGNGVESLEQKIAKFESLLVEIKEATREAHSAQKALNQEKREIERLMSTDIKVMVTSRCDEVVKAELDKIGPEIRERTSLIYDRIGKEIDKLIELSLGKEFSASKGMEDVRPALAKHLREWLKENVEISMNEAIAEQARIVMGKNAT